MEIETPEASCDQEVQTLQRCNDIISSINSNLSATLANLDHLSESISRY